MSSELLLLEGKDAANRSGTGWRYDRRLGDSILGGWKGVFGMSLMAEVGWIGCSRRSGGGGRWGGFGG